MLRILKSYMLPIAMLIGIVFSEFFAGFAVIAPYLIFTMLFVTYCKVPLKDILFSPFHYYLVAIQLLGSMMVYGIVYLINPEVAEGGMICVLAPTATSAAVITGMLGGDVASLTAYSLLSNLGVALFAPAFFSLISDRGDIGFISSLLHILKEVFPLLLAPILVAFVLQKSTPQIYAFVQKRQSISFYLWALALTIMIGKTVLFVKQQSAASHTVVIETGILTCIICVIQFITGRKIGARYHNAITGGQGLFQKNTVLAIWMAQSYLNPIASVGPGAYILWQNCINSYQLWLKQHGKTLNV